MNAVVDVVNPDISVYRASLKVDPPDESKSNTPPSRLVLKESGTILAIIYLLSILMVIQILKEYE